MRGRIGWLVALAVVFVVALALGVWFGTSGDDNGGTGTLEVSTSQ